MVEEGPICTRCYVFDTYFFSVSLIFLIYYLDNTLDTKSWVGAAKCPAVSMVCGVSSCVCRINIQSQSPTMFSSLHYFLWLSIKITELVVKWIIHFIVAKFLHIFQKLQISCFIKLCNCHFFKQLPFLFFILSIFKSC